MTYYAQFQGYLLPSLINDRITLATLVVGQFLAIILSFSPFTQGDPWLRLGLISLFYSCCCADKFIFTLNY